jgi:hypothetical protein
VTYQQCKKNAKNKSEKKIKEKKIRSRRDLSQSHGVGLAGPTDLAGRDPPQNPFVSNA